jgi:outer membrane receptor for monomeric catechols
MDTDSCTLPILLRASSAMTVRWGWRAVALTGFVTLLAAIAPLAAQQAQRDDIDALNRQVVQLYRAGQYAKAMELAKQSAVGKEIWPRPPRRRTVPQQPRRAL